jgi:hypothetical protein
MIVESTFLTIKIVIEHLNFAETVSLGKSAYNQTSLSQIWVYVEIKVRGKRKKWITVSQLMGL